MRLLTLVAYSMLATTVWAELQTPRPAFVQVWHRSNQEVSVRLDGIVPHAPAFVGEDAMRARLRFLNTGKASVFVQAFDLTSGPDDAALLHDVFAKEACREVENSPHPNYNPGGALRIGYSRLETSSIVEVAPGGSLRFSVPLDHLSCGRCARVRYWVGSDRRPTSQDRYRFLWFGPSRQ